MAFGRKSVHSGMHFSMLYGIFAATLLALVTPVLPNQLIPSQSSAVAAPLGSRITVVLDRLTPVVPQPGDTLRINGRLVNTTGADIDGVTVRLGVSAAPLETRAQVNELSALELNPANEMIDYFLDKTGFDLTETLRAGEEQSFRIQIPVDSLPLGRDGVYGLMVEVRGTPVTETAPSRLGAVRTFIPWATGDVDPVSLVWLWPLADYPAREADGVLLNEDTPRSLAPNGRLHGLLKLGAERPGVVSWIADPELLQTAQDISGGYQVRGESSESADTLIGELSGDAGAWLSTLNTALNQAKPRAIDGGQDRLPLRPLPYADVDASALERAEMNVDIVRATTMAPTVASTILGESVSGTTYWAPFGRLNKNTADVLASSGVRTVILDGAALAATDSQVPNTGLGVLATTFGGVNAVLMDPGLTKTLSLPQRSTSQGIEVRQRFLAETLIASQLIPADAASRYMVAGPRDIRWNPHVSALRDLLAATTTAPWLEPATLTDLIAEGATTTARQRGGYGAKAKNAELDQEYLAQVQRVSGQLASLTAVLDNPTGFSDAYAEAILRSESSAWRSDPQTGEDLIRSIGRGLKSQIDQVYVLSEGTVTLSGEQGLVPVTIANDLDRAVTVGVQLRGYPTARLVSEPMYDITIEPGKKVSVELDARVVGGRTLSVGVQLLTPDGQNFGSPAQIQVVSTAYARAAAWVIAAAFIAIVIFVVVGITRRIHKATVGGRRV